MLLRISPFLSLSLLLLGAVPGQAHLQGMYRTQAEAARRAAELKCQGTHQHGERWMPCADEKALHEALERQ